MKLPIYMDYSATTPVDPRVAQKMIPYLTEHFGNPASRSHAFGWEAEAAVEEARKHVAALIGADPKEIVWTSGATEGNNLAIKGAAQFYKTKGRHLVTQKTEHKATLDTMRELERQGFECTYLDVEENGLGAYMKEEALPSIDALRADGYDVTSYAYPYGARTSELDDALLKHVAVLRSVSFSIEGAIDPCPR